MRLEIIIYVLVRKCVILFADQSLWDDSNACLPGTIPVHQAVIGPITFTSTEVESVLNSLKTVKTEKAAGLTQ